MDFKDRLKLLNISPDWYLVQCRYKARKAGLNYKTLKFSTHKKKKLMIVDDNLKYRHFGSAENNDFIIWQVLEENGLVRKGYAEMKQRVFWQSHTAMKYNINDYYSPNNLSLIILW